MTLDDYINWMSGGDPSGLGEGAQSALAMNAVGGGISAGAGVIGGLSQIMAGIQADKAAGYRATQLRQNADAAQAVGTRQAYDVGRQTDMVQSRALAVAAASGGGASDPGVVTLMANTAAEGAYRKALALYNGQDKARSLEMEADSVAYEGKVAKRNALIGGALQMVGGGSSLLASRARGNSLYQRFSGGGPNTLDPGLN